ncbi:MAG: type II toxin-antitoxin system VapC family toxin [Candidatus Diapherotrites archaeon]|uniref:Type II toxin-antitoxin system VapC family toxin n=1 Tax=Candidatus Iainarchaeum sp. TaxID=3101447 RepID=A0A8T4CBW7_9ARCH|nr:type II toxin-antitoxin system VapC family toxin [Candidatus Diapherotrites archaeon]
MARIYLDANVFISYVKQEMGWDIRGLFIEAKEFLIRVKEKKDTIILSDLFFYEVRKKTRMEIESIIGVFQSLGIEHEVVELSAKLNLTEYERAGIHYPDSLHVGIAVWKKCDIIVTFNINDFLSAAKWIKAIQPSYY